MVPVSPEQFAASLAEAPVVAILRGVTPDTILPVCEALQDAGVTFVETTLNSPVQPIESIRLASRRFSGAGLHIGAGTVLTPGQVDEVADAGGTYIISPNFNPDVVRRTRERGLISIPGFFTPSEAFAAADAGAHFLKCFPAHALGVRFLKDLSAVLPNPVIAVGGVNADTVRDYLDVAVGVGVGSSLYRPDSTPEQIRQDAAAFLAAARATS